MKELKKDDLVHITADCFKDAKGMESIALHTWWVSEDVCIEDADTPVILENENFEKIEVLSQYLYFGITNLDQALSWRAYLAKEQRVLQAQIDAHSGTFDELCKVMTDGGGDNVDDEYFDIHTECGIWTVHNVGCVENEEICLSRWVELFEGGQPFGLFDSEELFKPNLLLPKNQLPLLSDYGRDIMDGYNDGVEWI